MADTVTTHQSPAPRHCGCGCGAAQQRLATVEMSVRAGEPFAFCRDDDGGDDVPGSFLPFFLVGGTRIPRIGSRWRVSPDVFVLLRKGQTVKMPTFGIMRCVEPPLTHALFSLGEMQPAAAPVWLFFFSLSAVGCGGP